MCRYRVEPGYGARFPDAKIISLEPSKKNYETLLLNVNGFGNVIPLHAGLWKSMSQLRLVNCTTNGNSWEREWGFQVEEVSNWNETEAEFIMTGLTVEFLLRLFDLQSFDFAKIDIEGSEKELFTRSETNTLKWMESTSLFMVEVHDMMRAGAKAIVDGVFNKSGDNKFHMLKDYGMFQAWTNTRLIPTSS
ncbi:hypothetical protein CBR_g2693 [Chara braunii]|uniref:Methyltransferase FkbM domain-containing protein n=1 Tax=Chara braunii TaxID=69332 RepID=A0A388KDK3_CHABU|nr:hypothetical protein CBR_g2693 [Chara braunii]|eukprot:GBG68142.1 hypothetical protein CBR_g2693 [Chara braunii]